MMSLFTDSNGKISHTKVWSNIAYLSATIIFLYYGFKGTLTTEVWFLYLGIVAGHNTASKFLSSKQTSA